MKRLFLAIACLAVSLCTACSSSIPEEAYSGNCTLHTVGYSSEPSNYRMYSSEEYAFNYPVHRYVDHKDNTLEIKMYLGDSTATEYLKVGSSELFTLTDADGNVAYVYVTYSQSPSRRFWGID